MQNKCSKLLAGNHQVNMIISGGGTGGHIFPAIAIAEALNRIRPELEVIFVGSKYGMERELVPRQGFPLFTLPIRGFLGKGFRHRLALLWRLPASLLLSLYLLARYRPVIVIGVGGYASGPLLFCAALLRVPTLIQEQNAQPGITNCLASRIVKLACLGFGEAAHKLHCPSIVTGNPVRVHFEKRPAWDIRRKTVLILGGSQGARALNRSLPQLLSQVMDSNMLLNVVHQCGPRFVAEVEQAYADAPFPVTVTSFIDDMGSAMDRALLIICRAGASTIAELTLTGVPALLVPLPSAAHDHQTFNAMSLAKTGAVRLIPEAELAVSGQAIRALLEDRSMLTKMAAAYPQARENAANRCASIALELIKKKEVAELVAQFGTHV